MKKIFILLAIVLTACSSEEEASQVKCGKIVSKGWNPQSGTYIKIEGYPNEVIPVTGSYELNQQYCY